MNPLKELHKFGQSIWLDFVTRRFIQEGGLKNLVENDGLTGVTSNPTIFQKAITGSADYDKAIETLIGKGLQAPEIFEELAVDDIQQACDVLMPVFKNAKGADGFVSLEVNPLLARDAQATLAEARRLFSKVARPNLMIKIPAALESLPAIEGALADGINVNVTLIFSLKRYSEVIEAWLKGLERAAASGRDLSSINSVASFFISRVDSMIDPILEKKGQESLMGLAAVANAKLAYKIFQEAVAGPRFAALAKKGARVQRPLWASTSTKNPRYRDVLYVEELIGQDTVNTLPPQTIDAFRDHGKSRLSIVENVGKAEEALVLLKKAGIDMDEVTRRLEEEGVKSFTDSYESLLQSIGAKRPALKSGVRG